MYYYFLLLHSWNRWLVLITGLAAITISLRSIFKKEEFGPAANLAGRSFVSAFDLQLLLGLLLYFIYSPFVSAGLEDLSAAMKTKSLRYWTVEHIFGMVVAGVFVHIGRAKSKKGKHSYSRHKNALMYYVSAILLVLGTVYFAGRPWFRF